MKTEELEDKLSDLVDYSGAYGIPESDIPDIISLFEQQSIDFAEHLSGIITNGDDLFSFKEEYINWIKD